MNDLTTLTARPRPMVVGGVTYMIHPLTLSDYGDLQAWVDRQYPDPLEIVSRAIEKGSYNITQQQFMIRTAIEQATRARNLIGTPEVDELLLSMEGYKAILVLSIKKGDPNFTEADAEKLFKSMTSADVAGMLAATTLDMVISDPKQPPLDVKPPVKPNGSTTSRRHRRAEKASTGGDSSTGR
jgi:hypothetical protein